MLTRRGLLLAATALPLAISGRLFGILELYVLAATALIAPAAALLFTSWARPSTSVERSVVPPKVHAGDDARVELVLRNTGRRRTSVLAVGDPFDGGRRWARFLVPPLAPGATTRAAYRLPTDARGMHRVGPLEVEVTDPLGLARVVRTSAGRTLLVVWPRIDQVAPLPHTIGHDPRGTAQRPRAATGVGEELFALRPYVVGDDLRRVHWPSSARTGELVVRQDQLPWQGRATVLLDLRRAAHTPQSLELAVSAAASVVAANIRRGSQVRLLATDGTDSGFGAGGAHLEAILTKLAGVSASAEPALAGPLRLLQGTGMGGAVAYVGTALVPAADIEALGRLRGRFGRVVATLFEPSSWEGAGSSRRPAQTASPAAVEVVRPRAGTPFPEAWAEVIGPPGARPVAARGVRG